MLLNLSPLIHRRDYRFFYVGQFVSMLGSMMTYVALPYQIYRLTGSSLAVGLIGVAQLAPLLLAGLIGGAYADAADRRRILIAAECVLALCSTALALDSSTSHPHIWMVYALAALGSGANGFHGPARSAMVPRLVGPEEISAASALNSLKDTCASVIGPAIAGILIASAGVTAAYFVDALSFSISLTALGLMKPMPAAATARRPGMSSIAEGLKYASSRQELLGTYAVDFIAMIFGMPMALFPAVAEGFGGAKAVGWLYSAPAAGAMLASLSSSRFSRIHRHGAAIVVAALAWGLAIVAFGYAPNLGIALVFLALAGAADAVSGIFRNTIWNGTIPDQLRGRLAGVEMISFMSGPLLGNAESGIVAAIAGTQFSIVSGGILCVVGVALCAAKLPKFWIYNHKLGKGRETA